MFDGSIKAHVEVKEDFGDLKNPATVDEQLAEERLCRDRRSHSPKALTVDACYQKEDWQDTWRAWRQS
ncbi:unnamed protein product [Brassica rapa]|uniref:Uncharacterized protein n=1 Tax=Brassica campestris TaxID=3711 RepID=A0A3P5XXZ5_BRACM|nr:unnamed protein product [Brassica rapa]VDC59907.1 unnamed protein product [Brassica rapa]